MEFRHLQARLLAHLSARMCNGEMTERSLARLSGISQPHIHNVLKGVRVLSLDLADQILRCLYIDLADLLTADERRAADCQMVPFLDGWIGPGNPYPHGIGMERYPFWTADVANLQSPVVARLIPDPRSGTTFRGGVALLDRAEGPRLKPEEDSYFALDLGGESAISLVRRTGRSLYRWELSHGEWQSSRLPDRDPLDLIQGTVKMIMHSP